MATTTVINDTRTFDQSDITVRATWLDRVIATSASWPLMVARLSLGIVMLPHGLQKTFGMFGGQGFSGTMSYMEGQGIPAALAFLAIMAEFAGSLGLIVGLFTRIAAFGIFCNMVVAIATVHATNGFFMNWQGSQAGEGFEYHLLAIGLAIIAMIGGAGLFSVDRGLFTNLQRRIVSRR